jgi:hypothetical protein
MCNQFPIAAYHLPIKAHPLTILAHQSEKVAQVNFKMIRVVGLISLTIFVTLAEAQISVTTASGSRAPPGPYYPGQIIFEDHFNTLDFETWDHENTLAGGGNWEFQW